MTRREARRRLGTRTSRRSGTKFHTHLHKEGPHKGHAPLPGRCSMFNRKPSVRARVAELLRGP